MAKERTRGTAGWRSAAYRAYSISSFSFQQGKRRTRTSRGLEKGSTWDSGWFVHGGRAPLMFLVSVPQLDDKLGMGRERKRKRVDHGRSGWWDERTDRHLFGLIRRIAEKNSSRSVKIGGVISPSVFRALFLGDPSRCSTF